MLKKALAGLRDLQMIGWVAQAPLRWLHTSRLGTNMVFLTNQEYRDLTEYQNFLWQVRFRSAYSDRSP